jgi:glycine/D-amino acid oxidase-like deaminating enzyme
MSKQTAVVIGAGPAGLTAAYELLQRTSIQPIVLEQDDIVGGISRTVNSGAGRTDKSNIWAVNTEQDYHEAQGEESRIRGRLGTGPALGGGPPHSLYLPARRGPLDDSATANTSLWLLIPPRIPSCYRNMTAGINYGTDFFACHSQRFA